MRINLDNRTNYPTPEVRKIIKWVANGLEVVPQNVRVSYLETDRMNPCAGMAYFDQDEPTRFSLRIRRPLDYPLQYNPYKRLQGPPPWEVRCWKEALVAIAAHEFQHLRQYCLGRRLTEHDTEWAAYRYMTDYRKEFLASSDR